MNTRLLTALATALLLFAACGDGDPTATDSPSPSPTPSTPAASASVTPTPTETTTPEVEREKPKAFIKRWVEVSNEMQRSGDTTAYREITEGCAACAEFADQIAAIYAAGGRIETDGWTVKGITATGTTNEMREFTLAIDSAPTKYQESADSPPQQLDGGQLEPFVQLKRHGTSWRVHDYGQYST